jgi:type I restriction enzyme M protein
LLKKISFARDKTSLDITWLKDRSLADLDNLPDPDMLAEEIAENLESGLGSFREVLRQLKGVVDKGISNN